MKMYKRLFTMIMVVILMFSITIQTTFAATTVGATYDLYANEESETLDIEGINYTYNYYYENGCRAIDIVNNESGQIDKLVYDELDGTIFLNEDQFVTVDNDCSAQALGYTNGWEPLGKKSSHYISWGEATTAAVVAGMIAIYLGSLGTAGVIAAMGVGALGVLAASASGGTLTVECQWYHTLFFTQYRYIWSFKASTGDTYGPYISTVSM